MLCFKRVIIKEKMRRVFRDIKDSVMYGPEFRGSIVYDHPSAIIRCTGTYQFQAHFCVVCGEYIGDCINKLVSRNCVCKCICRLKTTFVYAKFIVKILLYKGGDELLHHSINTKYIFDYNKRRLLVSILDYFIEEAKKHIPYEIKAIIYRYIAIDIRE